MPRNNGSTRRRPGRPLLPAAVGTAAALALLMTGCTSAGSPAVPPRPPGSSHTGVPAAPPEAPSASAAPVPRPEHVVVVVEENHSYGDIIGNTAEAPYLNALARRGAVFTHSFAVRHPSQPNYLALFSGSTQGLRGDSCPHTYTAPTLASMLHDAGLSFAGYAESLPRAGYPGCVKGPYVRRHAPWTDFRGVPGGVNLPWSDFPRDYSALPTVAFVIPDLRHDMHDGTVREADTWLRRNLDGYARWAMTHRSLLVVTWDEDDGSVANHIPTLLVGEQVRPGRYPERIDHYRVLRTLETAYGLRGTGSSAAPITDVWRADRG